ncbi:hypothetical protein ALC60_10666, partial [Trachymyrmex zeteki]
LRILNKELKTGYVPRLRLDDDIYLGDAVITNRDGKAYLRVINTSEVDKELLIPHIKLQEIDEIGTDKPQVPGPSAEIKAFINETTHPSDETNNHYSSNILNDINDPEVPDDTQSINDDSENLTNDSDFNSSDSKTDYDTENEATLFDTANTPYELMRKNDVMFQISREILSNRKDNLVIFINPRGEPHDRGAHALNQAKIFPKVKDVIARARPIPHKQKYIIALTVNDKVSDITEKEILEESIYSLLDIVKECRNCQLKKLVRRKKDACRRLHETGATRIANAVIDLIQHNTTNLRSVTLAGSASIDGRCSGAQYTDGTWENVLVEATNKITLSTVEAAIKRASGQVILPSGTRCPVAQGYCLDSRGHESYWPPVPIDHYHFDQYNILYEGVATKLTPKRNQTTPTVYTVTTRDTTFALTKTVEMNVCGYQIVQTEHPKLFILETHKGRTFATSTRVAIENLDIFLYENSKFFYVEKHIKT